MSRCWNRRAGAVLICVTACGEDPRPSHPDNSLPGADGPGAQQPAPDPGSGEVEPRQEMWNGSPASVDPGAGAPPVEPRPSVQRVIPSGVALGGSVRVEGAGFEPNPQVLLGDRQLAPALSGHGFVEFVVPTDLGLGGCSAALELRVKNDEGVSDPLLLDVREPPPELAPTELSVPAGELLVLQGKNLSQAEMRLGGRVLSAGVAEDGSLSVMVPANLAPGSAELVVTTACSDARLVMNILAPLAQILQIVPPRLAVGGVAFIRSDLAVREDLIAVRVGSTLVDAGDPRYLAWPSTDDPGLAGLFGIRLPEGFDPGSVQVALELTNGSTQGVGIDIVPAPNFAPGSPSEILFPPTRAANDGTFPISTTSAFMLRDSDDNTESSWFYYLNFRADGSASAEQCLRGTVGGLECYYVVPQSGANLCGSADMTFPLQGSYVLDTGNNKLELTIDRGTNGGVEQYVGGWMMGDGGPADSAATTGAFILLVSQQTGRQLRIRHSLTPSQRCF